ITKNRSARALAVFFYFEPIREKGGHYRGPFVSSDYPRVPYGHPGLKEIAASAAQFGHGHARGHGHENELGHYCSSEARVYAGMPSKAHRFSVCVKSISCSAILDSNTAICL